MKAGRLFYLFILLLFALNSCQKESTVLSPQNPVLVEGTWVGKLESDSLVLTFIEGEFEGSPTLSGSAFITSIANASSYVIMNGSHDRQKNVMFSLYKIPVTGKEEFQLTGTLDHNIITGTFSRFNPAGTFTKAGSWSVKTWY